MRNDDRSKKKKNWRDEFVPRSDFQCACGCELQLSRGDLADAIRCALPFNGKPRTGGVIYTNFGSTVDRKLADEELIEKQICTACRYAVVETPVFAAQLLRERGADWPVCSKCRAEGAKPARLRLVP
jgi:hypothetical protein